MYAEQCVFVTIWEIAMCDGISFHLHILYIVAWTYNYIGTKAKCRHLKRFTGKGTLRQVFLRVYRLEMQSVMLVFSTQLCELLLL
jgi:hypothetical protein